MKIIRWYGLVAVWAGTIMGLVGVSSQAQIPTRAERIRDSGMNPSNCAWKAHEIRVWPLPAQPVATNRMPLACIRKEFTLTAAPRQAAMTFLLLDGGGRQVFTRINVNGKLALDVFPTESRNTGSVWRHLDLKPFLRQGHNVLTLVANRCTPDYGYHLAAEGIVFGEDGSMLRLLTDGTWAAGWDLAAGWDNPDTTLTNLPPADSCGIMGWRNDYPYMNPPYYGPIQVAPAGMSQPIFDEETPVELKVTVINAQGRAFRPLPESGLSAPALDGRLGEAALPVLAYDIFDEQSRKNVGQGVVELKPEGKLDLAGALKAGPLAKGAYRIRLELLAGTHRIDRRDYEVASVGAIAQRLVAGTQYEDGMEFKEIWHMDCTQEPKPGEFIALKNARGDAAMETRVVESPAGRYREMVSPDLFGHFAYRFKVKKLFAPHLAVIEWPDDKIRKFQVQVLETSTMFPGGFGAGEVGRFGWTRGEAAVMGKEDYPLSGKMQKLHFFYWPNEEEEAIHVWNISYNGAREPAAAARLTIYEIANDLPALRIKDAGDRLTGYHTERGVFTMAARYYAGPWGAFGPGQVEFYRNWYTTTANMIKQMRFAGQNLYWMGQFMYDGVCYPSQHFPFALNNNFNGADYGPLILRMFERNGMALVSGIEYTYTPDLIGKSPATIAEVRAGAPTLFMVTKDGEFQKMLGAPVVNFHHPEVQKSLLTIVDELVELYAGYPAWQGLAFVINSTFAGPLARFVKEPLDSGLEDYTVELFEKETGVRVPVDRQDPQRFLKRYEWITANATAKWIDWRCAQYTALYLTIRDRLVKARPDLKLFLCLREPQGGRMAALGVDQHFEDAAWMKNLVRSMGFDPDALKQEKNVVISFMYNALGTQGTEYLEHGQASRVWWDLSRNQAWNDLFANDGRGGAYIWPGMNEYNKSIPKGKWLWGSTLTRQAWPWPPGLFLNDTFVNVLVRSNPTWMPHTWVDVNDPSGRLHEQRLFARAYRSLPNGKYERLRGNGLDTNLWVESLLARGAEYAYAANPEWWDLEEVTLTFADGVKVHDLIRDQPVDLKGSRWTFRLGPYAVQTFRVDGGQSSGPKQTPSAVRGAAVKVAETGRAELRARIAQVRIQIGEARAREAEIKSFPGWAQADFLDARLKEVEELLKAGDFTLAQGKLSAWRMLKSRQQLVSEALEAVPFLVLGPFGDPKSTLVPPASWYEVGPEFKGMETTFLGESNQPDLSELKPGFAPDLKRTYKTYLDQQSQWKQTIRNSEYLPFDDICRTEDRLAWMVAYAYTEVYSPQDRQAVLLAGNDHAIWIWVNDKIAIRHGGQGTRRGGQRPSRMDQDRADIRLQQGWNRVLIKVVERQGARLFFRIADGAGDTLTDLKYRVPKTG